MQGDITFHGAFILDKPLTSSHLAYLEKFTGTDRYKRNSEITATRPDPIREAVNLPIGLDGAYFVGGNHCFSGKREEDIVSFMNPPKDHPSHLCYWTSNSDGSQITCNDCYFPKYKEW